MAPAVAVALGRRVLRLGFHLGGGGGGGGGRVVDALDVPDALDLAEVDVLVVGPGADDLTETEVLAQRAGCGLEGGLVVRPLADPFAESLGAGRAGRPGRGVERGDCRRG